MSTKSRTLEELGRVAADEVRAANLTLVRSVVVNGEPHFIQQLVSNVSNDNEADAIVLVGGTGFGPKDTTVDAIDTFCERRIEGFGDAYRLLLRDEMGFGPHAWLSRATAGVYNQCLVFAMTGRPNDVKRAMQSIIVPTLSDAVELATGRMRTVHLRA
ncbi:MAG TPA: molybdopterin-binding protein [Polyangiaceae bacterium]|jgi:molybdenum cofactor synthesis domain-containing protein